MADEQKDSRPTQGRPAAQASGSQAGKPVEAPSGEQARTPQAAEQPVGLQEGGPGARPELPSGQTEPAGQPEEGPAPEVRPPEIHGVHVPLVGELPLRTVAILACVAALAFLAVLIIGLSVMTPAPALPAYHGGPIARVTAGEGAAPAAPLADLSPFGYEELMEQGERCAQDGDLAAAVRLFREASEREDAGLPRVLLARHKLSEALLRLGRHQDALRICESLRAVSRPGDELWKNALISSIRVLSDAEQWEDFFRHVYLLRANTARYPDEPALNRWLAYCVAMAKVRILLDRSPARGELWGVAPPALGRAPCGTRPLVAEDIVPTSGRYGDGTLRAEYQMGELRLLSEGAPLGQVLAEVAQKAGLNVAYEGPADYVVSASLETLSPEQALELVLGSVGLEAAAVGDKMVVRRLQPLPGSDADALKAALWGLQEFLILYPESVQVGEAYYALGHLYMTRGQTKMALDQLDILFKEFARAPWSVWGHYIAGRARCDAQDWARAEADLLAVVDGDPKHPLSQSAFLWAAQCEVELGKYTEAVACFRRALAHETQDPLTPAILYKIAFCLEKSSASPLEVEERYTELRARYPGTEYARDADYRLARMALDAGDCAKAVARYEFYMTTWPVQYERTRQACRDLVSAYLKAGDPMRAALLGEVMAATFPEEPECRDALPAVLEAHAQAGLHQMGLEVIEKSLDAAQDAEQRLFLTVAKARFLADTARYDEAKALLDQVAAELPGRDLLHEARLVEAQMLMATGQQDQGLALCREAALKGRSDEVRAKALTLMAQQYTMRKEFDRAALAYAGKCPLEGGGSSP